MRPFTVDDFPRRSAPPAGRGGPCRSRAPSESGSTAPSGRVAATDVTSAIDVPPFAAIGDGRLRGRRRRHGRRDAANVRCGCASSSASTRVAFRRRRSRRAVREIATGAALPAGADAVVMVEETARAGEGEVDIVRRRRAGRRTSGGAARTSRPGSVVARAATCCTRAASARSPPWARPTWRCTNGRASRFSRPATRSSSRAAAGARPDLRRQPLHARRGRRRARRRRRAARRRARRCRRARARARRVPRRPTSSCFPGGSSVGERDLILDLVSKRGTMIFHGIAVKPGKPTAFATIDGTPFFGMPGNPTSCLSNAYILLVPFLRATARLPPLRAAHAARAARPPHPSRRAGRHTFYTVTHRRRRGASRRSRDRATSPACRRPTATSRFPRIAPSWKSRAMDGGGNGNGVMG